MVLKVRRILPEGPVDFLIRPAAIFLCSIAGAKSFAPAMLAKKPENTHVHNSLKKTAFCDSSPREAMKIIKFSTIVLAKPILFEDLRSFPWPGHTLFLRETAKFTIAAA